MLRLLQKITLFVLLFLGGMSFALAQDFFEEEKDSILWFYDIPRHASIVAMSNGTTTPYGLGVWIHHPKYKFSTYVENKFGYEQGATVQAKSYSRKSIKEVSGNKIDLTSGIGVGSTIKENYLWYFNIGLAYSTVIVPHDYVDGHKLEQGSPFKVHFGGGVAAVLSKHIHLQVGIDLESMRVNGGVGFVF